jgi:hypothetical protein
MVSKYYYYYYNMCARDLYYLYYMCRYSTFTAPLPDPAACLRALEALATSSSSARQHEGGAQGQGGGGGGLTVLHCDSSSITVAWQLLAQSESASSEEEDLRPSHQRRGDGACGHSHSSDAFVVSIRPSRPGFIGSWVEVYRGMGKGCSISNLEAATSYHVKLASFSSFGGGSNDESSATYYIMAHTNNS